MAKAAVFACVLVAGGSVTWYSMGVKKGEPNTPVTSVRVVSKYCFAGVPKPIKKSAEYSFLHNEGYDIGFSVVRKVPLWGAYRLRSDVKRFDVSRPEGTAFKSEKRILGLKLNTDDYTFRGDQREHRAKGYDRGHMAPSDAIGQWYGDKPQLGTFIVSNICPQREGLNREVWQGLEAAETMKLPEMFDQTWVICGPIFGATPEKIGANKVDVPKSFYKIIVENDTGQPAILAVIMKQTDEGFTHTLSDFVTTVSDIERQTGLNFFSDLPDAIERVVESRKADPSIWPLDMVLSRNTIKAEMEAAQEEPD